MARLQSLGLVRDRFGVNPAQGDGRSEPWRIRTNVFLPLGQAEAIRTDGSQFRQLTSLLHLRSNWGISTMTSALAQAPKPGMPLCGTMSQGH